MKLSASIASLAVATLLVAAPASAQWTPATNPTLAGSASIGSTTTRPNTKLLIHGGAFGELHFDMAPTSQFASGTLRFTQSNDGGNTFTTLGYVSVCSTHASSPCAGEMQVGTIAAGPLKLYTNNTARLSITTAGRVNVGTVTGATVGASDVFVVYGDATVTGNIAAKYQDVAEWVPASEPLESGMVVVLDKSLSNVVKKSSAEYDSAVAGVVSVKPGLILGERGDDKVMVATTGRVKVKVDAGTAGIKVGDLLVTSSKPGMAMKSQPIEISGRKFHQPGTVIGKALEPLANGQGEILVLLSMQ